MDNWYHVVWSVESYLQFMIRYMKICSLQEIARVELWIQLFSKVLCKLVVSNCASFVLLELVWATNETRDRCNIQRSSFRPLVLLYAGSSPVVMNRSRKIIQPHPYHDSRSTWLASKYSNGLHTH